MVSSARLECALQNGPRGRAPTYILTLMRYAIALGVRDAAFQFAEALARGLRDVLVVLLEPLEYFQTTTLAEGISASHTLKEIDQFLKQASNNKRNLSNTVVFDVRIFLTAQMRKRRSTQEFAVLEERSFDVFQQMVEELNPAVILTCQCATANAKNAFVRQMSSTFPPRPDLAYLQIHGRRVPLLKAFHPGVYKEEHIQRWAGSDRKKQEECRRILTALLGVWSHVPSARGASSQAATSQALTAANGMTALDICKTSV
ncbi:hypothetical protein BBAD15_g11237 [Beauveria bassiana D1-5]|uniref:Uncharacterized protein n=1 Tax=Beauveria bassiana D1-5 TaxID=1245745 RepID=A0A0A2VB00_BEABA|nr:hypothetical protein BBAD15_g11237 [Beauveria bassiana D1-5]